jgi:hypothetical protein
MNETLENRITRLEAIEDIRRLKARYAELADAKYVRSPHRKKSGKDLAEAVAAQAACFTEDVEWDAGPFGVLKGRPALAESFAGKPFWFTLHGYMNPVIDVEGDTASGRWLHWLLVSHEGSAKATHMMGYSNERYRRVDGAWQISHMRLEVLFDVPFGENWTK